MTNNLRFLILAVLIFLLGHLSFSQVLTKITISGNKQVSNEKLLTLIKSRWHTKLDTIQVETDRKVIENFYFEEGFLEARCQAISTFDKKLKSVSINFEIFEGSVYKFGSIEIEGTKLLKKDFVYKLINIFPGERFSRDKIIKSQIRAFSTGLFKDIEIKAKNIDSDLKKISVIIYANEKKRYAADIGYGIDTEDGMKLFFEWKNRNFNGKGTGISLTALSSIDYINDLYYKRGNFGIGFTDPYLFYLPVEWRLQLLYNSDKPKYVNFGIENYTAETIFGHQLSLVDEITLRLRIQNDRIFNATFQTEHKEFINVFRVDDNRFIGIMYEHDQRDDLIDPSSGLYFNVMIEKAGGFLGGRNSFVKVISNLQNYYNVFRLLVLANKITLGSIESGQQEPIPSYLRLFMGGSGSLRGFPERSVGPKNTDGSAQGGRFLFLNNLELRYYLSYAFNIVTFFDVGNIWVKRTAATINSLNYSTGLGFRLRTKFGFFRLDFGLRLNEFPEKYIGKLHFGFGQTF